MFDRIHRLRRGGVGTVAVLAAVALFAGCGGNDNGQNSLDPKGPESRQILDLFRPFFWIATVIGVGVIVATIVAALKFRERPGVERSPKQIHGNSVLEISWTIIPALILAVMAVFTIPVIFDLNEEPTGADVIRITVTGRQWFWEYHYDDEKFSTATELHIPVNRPIAMRITAPEDGVIHSFWIPELNGKKDAVPGRDEPLKMEADEPGTYLGQCAEYCGLSHADMRMRVIAQTQDEYDAWVRAQKEPLDAQQASFVDSTLNQKWGCIACHSLEPESSVRIGPNLTHVGDRSTFAGGIYETNRDELTQWVHNAPSRKPFGDYNQHMPNFAERGMTTQDAREIAEFLCNTATTPENADRCLNGTGGDVTGPR
jgi:cytochrome c oxidase subunit II